MCFNINQSESERERGGELSLLLGHEDENFSLFLHLFLSPLRGFSSSYFMNNDGSWREKFY